MGCDGRADRFGGSEEVEVRLSKSADAVMLSSTSELSLAAPLAEKWWIGWVTETEMKEPADGLGSSGS